MMSDNTLLIQYSEWLDTQGLIVSEGVSGDYRSHEDLAADFVKPSIDR